MDQVYLKYKVIDTHKYVSSKIESLQKSNLTYSVNNLHISVICFHRKAIFEPHSDTVPLYPKSSFMNAFENAQSITINLINTGHSRFDEMAQYINVISPFFRLYYVEEGNGELVIGGHKIALAGGTLYMIPSFTPCSYTFEKGLRHYYIHCSIYLENGLNPQNLYALKNRVASTKLDQILFKRLMEITPGLELPHHDPRIYQNKLWMNKKISYAHFNEYLESAGILEQIFSRFVDSELREQVQNILRYNIQSIFQYIRENLKKDLTVEDLAGMAFLSKDHFSRVFKSVVGFGPCEFIIRQRLELAQLLLLTTDMTMEQIIEETNFKSLSYFSRIFKKFNTIPPSQYRKQRG